MKFLLTQYNFLELQDSKTPQWRTIEVVYPEGYSCIQTISTTPEQKDVKKISTNHDPKLKSSELKYEKKKSLLPASEFQTQEGYQCPQCSRIYTARRNLVRHLNLECGKEPKFKCPYCQYRNHRRNELKKHMKNRHGVEVMY